ncbi:MAG: hypothetical protein MJ033_07475 [Victivallaceae bacterium]|nr:hypothetical protein [Victivallaceae bacterium]
MKKISLFAGLLGIALLCGCRNIVHVNGKPCKMLYDSEEKQMQAIAVATLQHNLGKNNLITPSEYKIALQTEPKCKINYFSDLIGRAEYTWDFPTRTTTVVIQGEFLNAKQRLVFLSVNPKQPAVIDNTHRLPKNAPVFFTE